MKVERRWEGSEVAFVLSQVEGRLAVAVTDLAFRPIEGGFGQTYPANHPALDHIFAKFGRHIGAVVHQPARLRPVPWADALVAVCAMVEGTAIDWWLTGSAALAVRGLPVAPRDLDLVVDRGSAADWEVLMRDHLIEPPRPGFISDSFGRAFLHARVEWVAGIDERADQHRVGDVGPTAAARLETVSWRGHPIRVPPLALPLAVNQARGFAERAGMIRRAMGGDPPASGPEDRTG